MIFKQFYLGCLAHASYLVGDESSGVAVVVDPQRDVDQYIDYAAKEGLAIRHVFLTHAHADFLAGHLELRDRAGAAIHLGARSKAEFPYVAMKDGDLVQIGEHVALQTLETPGHTSDSICILILDRAAEGESNPAKWGVLTGDTLFVNDVGRPDLHGSLGWRAETLAGLLYESLHGKLLPLPDETRVYPAHGAGSLCGKALGSENFSTIGVQRRMNYALQPMTKEEFIGLVMQDQPDAPPYFVYDAVLNNKERPTLDQALEKSLKPLPLEDVLEMHREGAQLLDARDPALFEAAHLAGSMNIGLGGQYATWAGTLIDSKRPIVVVADAGREKEAALRLGRIGFDNVAGYLADGMQALESHPELVTRTERVSADELAGELAANPDLLVLDVRAAREVAKKKIEGSANIPLNHLQERIGEVPRGRRIVVHCAGGYRSSIAASVLKQNGYDDVADLIGGIDAWCARPALQASAVEDPR